MTSIVPWESRGVIGGIGPLPWGCQVDLRRRSKIPRDGASREATPLDVAVAANDRATIATVRAAVAGRRMRLAYQPVVRTQDTGRIAFHEGLIRVLDPAGRIIPARDFMAAIQDTELGREVDCATIELGLAELAVNPGLRLALNMSARSIGYRRWVDTLRRGLDLSPPIGERLILEISESSAMALPEVVMTFMEEMQARGVAFALDNFGAGQTELRHLKDFFFDILKIDAQFVRGIDSDPNRQALVAAINGFAREFQMFSVAESIETVEEANYLASIGVDCLQGYLFGAPTIRPEWSGTNARKQA